MADNETVVPDIGSPAARRKFLRSIPAVREQVQRFHEVLREVFRREIEYRRSDEPEEDEPNDHFENIYHCALLLYLIGDLKDVPLMWEAKTDTFDNYCGFDGQFMFGAGINETVQYVEQLGNAKLIEYVEGFDWESMGSLPEWEQSTIGYYYREMPGQQ